MPFTTITVGSAIAPTVLKTWISHYFGGKPDQSKPEAEIAYHEGFEVIRKFMYYASLHTVENFQKFTAMSVPSSPWIKKSCVVVPAQHLVSAGHLLVAQLGPDGVYRVGGKKWWQWRGDRPALRAEWNEMKSDYNEQKSLGVKSKRVMLYIHGGAFYFGSVDTHRHQVERHARKLKARVFSPNYRLAPQFPFPCGLQDCLAAYLYLLTLNRPEEILLAGDSSGGGMVASILVTLRDQKIPLPAGAILISPWLDLTHSFPSMNDNPRGDYLAPYGFMHRPSMAWPPPSGDETSMITCCADRILNAINSPPMGGSATSLDERVIGNFFIRQLNAIAHGGHVEALPGQGSHPGMPNAETHITVEMDGAMVEIKDQIHTYTTNQMLSHPLVSPILQPSLGGLPPLLVLTGGGELLRDEQIYFAHKAANPPAYPPGDKFLDRHDPDRTIVHQYKPTYVQFQLWDDVCHVVPTLGFTRPAKYMFRSIAQFGAWALSHAQETSMDIPDSSTDTVSNSQPRRRSAMYGQQQGSPTVGKAGDPLPAFYHHMIRQRVDKNGNIHPLQVETSLRALQVPPSSIGEPKAGPVRRWLAAKAEWDTKYSRQAKQVRRQRIEELVLGIEEVAPGETPPPTSLAGRRGISIRRVRKPSKKSRALSFWQALGSRHDETTLRASGGYTGARPRPVSETRVVTDVGQSNESERALSEKVPSIVPSAHPSAISSRYSDIPVMSGNADRETYSQTDNTITNRDMDDAYHHRPDSDYPRPLALSNIGKPTRPPLLAHPIDDEASTRAVRHAEGITPKLTVPEPSPTPKWQTPNWETPRESADAIPRARAATATTANAPTSATEGPVGAALANLDRQKHLRDPETPDTQHTLYADAEQDFHYSQPESPIHTRPRGYANANIATAAPPPPATAGPSRTSRSNTLATDAPDPGPKMGSLRRYKGKGIADDFYSNAHVPSETEPFPPYPAESEANYSGMSRVVSGYSSVYSAA